MPCLSVSYVRRHGTCPPDRLQPDYLKLHPIHVHPLFDPDGHQQGRRDCWVTSKIAQWVPPQVSTTYLFAHFCISIYRFSAHWYFPPHTCHVCMLLADIRGYINLSPPCTISMDSYSLRPDKGLLDIYITKVQVLGLPRFPGASNCKNIYLYTCANTTIVPQEFN